MGYLDENGLVYAWRRIREYIDDKLIASYEENIPKASTTEFGICKIGQGLRVVDGVVSNNYTVGIASSDELGLVKVGNTLEINDAGVLNVTHKANLYDEPKKYVQVFTAPTFESQYVSLYDDYSQDIVEKIYFVSANISITIPENFPGAAYNYQLRSYIRNTDNVLSENLQCCDEILLPETPESMSEPYVVNHSISGFVSVYFSDSIDAGISTYVEDANKFTVPGGIVSVKSNMTVIPVNIDNVPTAYSDASKSCDLNIVCTLQSGSTTSNLCQIDGISKEFEVGDTIWGSLKLNLDSEQSVYNSKYNTIVQLDVPGGIIPLTVSEVILGSPNSYKFIIDFNKVDSSCIKYYEDVPNALNLSIFLPSYYIQSDNLDMNIGNFLLENNDGGLAILYKEIEEAS